MGKQASNRRGELTSQAGRSSWRVKRRSQEQNAVEQVTCDDSEPSVHQPRSYSEDQNLPEVMH